MKPSLARHHIAVGIFAVLPVTGATAQWTAIRVDGIHSEIWGIGAGVEGGIWNDRPALWDGTTGQLTLLGAGQGWVSAISGDIQAGQLENHASLWRGSAESRIDLHPENAGSSWVWGASGDQQVGQVGVGGIHAALWRGTAASFVDLNPQGSEFSAAFATDGSHQGGFAQLREGTGYVFHATLWSGSPESMVDLHPAGAEDSRVNAVAPGVQVGLAALASGGVHAALWRGTAESFVDLGPEGFASSLNATTGSIHAGELTEGVNPQAALSFGIPGEWLNLHQVLPAGYNQSEATSIFQDGETLYVGGWAGTDTGIEAFIWVGTVPSPGAIPPALLGVLLGARRRRRTRT
jgi:hypothetical protein